MSIAETTQRQRQDLLRQLRELRRFQGTPAQFWPQFLESVGQFSGAASIALLTRSDDDPSWRRAGIWPLSGRSELAALQEQINAIADALPVEGLLIEDGATLTGLARGDFLLGIRLEIDEAGTRGVLALVVHKTSRLEVQTMTDRLQLIVDIPSSYQFTRAMQQARTDVVQFAATVDLMTLINETDRYMGAAMTLVNELAARLECDRVSLGWLDGPYVRLQAISHMEKFEKKMAAVQSLEAAMEEAFDQDEEIIWPVPEGTTAVTRDHERYATEQGAGNIVSLPVRVNDERVAVVTCERQSGPFQEAEVRGLRLMLDQAARHLEQLKQHDRWFGPRIASWAKERMGEFLGVEHTFAKALGIVVALILAYVLFGSWNYRVEAPFLLSTDDVVYLPTPFDGYIEEVRVKVGDVVEQGDLLLKLDTHELVLEEAIAVADIVRYTREADKARAQNALADMRIAQALVAQSEAQLEKVRYHLENANITAPFAGFVVEGDLRQMLGASVRKGDILFKVADIDKIYAEIDLPERDIHEIRLESPGEIAFISNPDEKFPIQVREVDPVAVTKEIGNVFVLRADILGNPASWWRPGMSGVAKVEVGDRNVLWIMTHRTVDFLRLLLWW